MSSHFASGPENHRRRGPPRQLLAHSMKPKRGQTSGVCTPVQADSTPPANAVGIRARCIDLLQVLWLRQARVGNKYPCSGSTSGGNGSLSRDVLSSVLAYCRVGYRTGVACRPRAVNSRLRYTSSLVGGGQCSGRNASTGTRAGARPPPSLNL
jgi:hypothetical protein